MEAEVHPIRPLARLSLSRCIFLAVSLGALLKPPKVGKIIAQSLKQAIILHILLGSR